MNLPTFLPDAEYQRLFLRLVDAAADPTDPASELKAILADYIAPEAARADIEAHAKVAARYATLKAERDQIGAEIAKWLKATGVQPDEDDDHPAKLLN